MFLQDATSDSAWAKRAYVLLAAVAALRLLYHFTVMDFQLSGDEVYYWDWGRRPDWGYYSKPPLIGWLMGAIRVCFDGSWHGVRVTSILLGTGTLGMMFLLGRAAFNARTGFIAMLLMLCTPLNVGLNIAMTIDVPLMLCWTAALWLLVRAVRMPQSTGAWVQLGLVIGLGSLAKQMMLLFPLLMMLWAAFTPSQRGLLRNARVWLAIVIGLCFLIPPAWWNSQHGWPTVKHTLEHNLAAGGQGGLLDHVMTFVQFPAVQALMLGGLTFALIVMALIKAKPAREEQPGASAMLWWFSAPVLLVFVALSIYKEVNPNWPAVAYVAAFPLVAWVAHRWTKLALIVGAGSALLVYAAVPVMGSTAFRGGPRDPFRDMREWEEVGKQMGALLASCPRPEKTFVYVTDHRHYVSMLAFWMPQHPPVYRWNRTGLVESQYEVWPDASDKRGWDALIVDPNNDTENYAPRELSGLIIHRFRDVKKFADVDIAVGNGTRRVFQVYLGHHMIRVPPAMKPTATAEH